MSLNSVQIVLNVSIAIYTRHRFNGCAQGDHSYKNKLPLFCFDSIPALLPSTAHGCLNQALPCVLPGYFGAVILNQHSSLSERKRQEQDVQIISNVRAAVPRHVSLHS